MPKWVEVTLTTAGESYKIACPGKTSDELAALAYDDGTRTNFNSVQDFARLALQKGAVTNALTSGMTASEDIVAIIVDQENGKTWAIGDQSANLAKAVVDDPDDIACIFEFDQALKKGYGE